MKTQTSTPSFEYCKTCGGFLFGVYCGNSRICTCKKAAAGWECPRCHKIHSPYSTTCDCHIGLTSSSTTLTSTLNKAT